MTAPIGIASADATALHASDLEKFERLGIGPDLIASAGVRRVTDTEARALLSANGTTGNLAGIAFPYIDPHRSTGRQ
jgi:hypothetical protein